MATPDRVTERVVVLMTPAQKSAVAQRAAEEALSLGDYMRRQALGDDELLDALMAELATSTEAVKGAMDRTLARLEAFEREREGIEADARARAEAEFRDSLDPQLFADLVRQVEIAA